MHRCCCQCKWLCYSVVLCKVQTWHKARQCRFYIFISFALVSQNQFPLAFVTRTHTHTSEKIEATTCVSQNTHISSTQLNYGYRLEIVIIYSGSCLLLLLLLLIATFQAQIEMPIQSDGKCKFPIQFFEK